MIGQIKVLDVELDASPQSLENTNGYREIRAMVRLHGTPIGCVEVPLPDGGLTAAALRMTILRRLEWPVIRHHLRDMIEHPLLASRLGGEELLDVPHPAPAGEHPLISVAVCTRDRPEDLRHCLDSLERLDYPRLDVMVIDNAPSNEATADLVQNCYPQVRYIREPKPGLDWARNRAIVEARGEIVAYTDDDVVVDPGWATSLAAAFKDPQVMAVTGLIVPYELETKAQILFERYGGFGRGFERKYWQIDAEGGERPLEYLGAGQYGTGANMAYRRGVFENVGPFDPALDVGTLTNGGGDLEMFFRVLRNGHLLAYEPSAVVRHRHRREYVQLREQIANNGIGFYSYLVRTALTYPDIRGDVLRFGLRWFWQRSVRRLIISFIRPSRFPRDLIWAELRGSLLGLTRYPKARRHAVRIAAPESEAPDPSPAASSVREPLASKEAKVCVRTVDLGRSLEGLDDVADHAAVRVLVTVDRRAIGSVDIVNRHQPLSATRLRQAIVDQLHLKLLERDAECGFSTLLEDCRDALRKRYLPVSEGTTAMVMGLTEDVPVSVIVATYDRPDHLRNCLRHLAAQESARPVEIVVVDNNPASGVTPPVVAEFPGISLVAETRQGLSYARNRGFVASRGDVVIATDDDVLAPSDWLEKLVAPFAYPDVMVTTGNTLPFKLETTAQQRFEWYGGLGRGFLHKEMDGRWFRSFGRRAVPTWEIGTTANAAFRASIFAHPDIGLLEETLGAGTPTGCGEDAYLFYKVLKAGYTIIYEPSAHVWHKHQPEMGAVRAQIYNYSKGRVAYHLTTLLRDHDLRAAMELAVRLPRWHLSRLFRYAESRLRRKDHYPLDLILTEVRGSLAGPWCLWRSYRHVKCEGRSVPYVPVAERTAAFEEGPEGA